MGVETRKQGEKMGGNRGTGFSVGLFLALALTVMGCKEKEEEEASGEKTYRVVAEYEVSAGSSLPSNIMLLIDKSGSMGDLVNEGKDIDGNDNPECDERSCNSGALRCSPICSTRINELRYAMGDFLNESLGEENSPPLGKFGLTLFPSSWGGASEAVQFAFATSDEDAVLRNSIVDIQTYILDKLYNSPDRIDGEQRPIAQGTPTGGSLRFLLNEVHELKDASRKNFILLLTDGLPNSNSKNEQDDKELGYCQDSNECVCTSSAISCKSKTSCGRDNCLDQEGTVGAIEELFAHNIKTIVVGFGTQVSVDDPDGIASEVLNVMAKAGGDVRECGEDSNCTSYYPAADRAELLKALKEISKEVATNPCVFHLGSDRPSSAELLAVEMNGGRMAAGKNTYSYDEDSNTVVFVKGGELCKRLESISSEEPSHISVLFLEEAP